MNTEPPACRDVGYASASPAPHSQAVRSEMKGTQLKLKTVLILFVLFTSICGCNTNDFLRNSMNKMAPDDDEALAKECLTALRNGDFEIVKTHLDPQIIKPNIESDLTKISKIFAHGEPIAIELVGCNVFSSSEKRRTSLTYQYQFPDAWVLAAVTIDTSGESKTLMGVNVNPLPKPLGELNAFTLSGKSVKHYILLALAVAVPVFIVWTIVLCARTKIRKKWLWIIFILVAVAKLNLNWTTGQMGFQPIAFQIPGSGIAKMGLYAPWILTISFPLGAIMFLIKRRKLIASALEEKDPAEPKIGLELPESVSGSSRDELST